MVVDSKLKGKTIVTKFQIDAPAERREMRAVAKAIFIRATTATITLAYTSH